MWAGGWQDAQAAPSGPKRPAIGLRPGSWIKQVQAPAAGRSQTHACPIRPWPHVAVPASALAPSLRSCPGTVPLPPGPPHLRASGLPPRLGAPGHCGLRLPVRYPRLRGVSHPLRLGGGVSAGAERAGAGDACRQRWEQGLGRGALIVDMHGKSSGKEGGQPHLHTHSPCWAEVTHGFPAVPLMKMHGKAKGVRGKHAPTPILPHHTPTPYSHTILPHPQNLTWVTSDHSPTHWFHTGLETHSQTHTPRAHPHPPGGGAAPPCWGAFWALPS